MIERDYVMRQVHQLAQVLARVMSLDATRRVVEGEEMLSAAATEITGLDLEGLRQANKTELVTLCTRGDGLSTELAVALADLLLEHSRILSTSGRHAASGDCRERALWLYRAARDAGGTLPLRVLGILSDGAV